MKINYVLVYGTPYLKTAYFETFEDISKYLLKKSIVDYSIYEQMNDLKEVEMIHLENDVRVLEQENQSLKRQNEYLRSGEYLNQLKFERNMLEDIVQNGGVSKEDKEFIDMTHRNTELLEENQSLKEQLLKLEDKYIHNVPCCNEEDCDFFKDYQSLKDRIEKAIEFINTWIYDEYAISIQDPENENLCSYDERAIDNLKQILKGDK